VWNQKRLRSRAARELRVPKPACRNTPACLPNGHRYVPDSRITDAASGLQSVDADDGGPISFLPFNTDGCRFRVAHAVFKQPGRGRPGSVVRIQCGPSRFLSGCSRGLNVRFSAIELRRAHSGFEHSTLTASPARRPGKPTTGPSSPPAERKPRRPIGRCPSFRIAPRGLSTN